MNRLATLVHSAGVAHIRLCRPQQRNALSTGLCADLLDALEELDLLVCEGTVRCALLEGEGASFCAGADLRERQAMSPAQASLHSRRIAECADAIAAVRCPVVALVQGHALGGGLELVLAADLRIVAQDALLGFPETDYGFFPGAGGPVRLARLVGMSSATYLLMTGARIDDEQALRLHIAHETCAAGELAQRGGRLARKIAAKPPGGVQALKTLLRRTDEEQTLRALALSRAMRDALNEDDSVLAIAARGYRNPNSMETP